MQITNIGILAHVDAGKTSLTERILFESGAIPSIGSVDAGTTRTDTMELERRRGITIRSAVVSFSLDDHVFNVVDTPGHPDFIAEVERALRVLDVVVLVVSAVEGVQPQTRRLFRAIRGLGLPCLLFANKIDRPGTRVEGLVEDLRRELGARPLVLSRVVDAGTREALSQPCDFNQPDAIEAAVEVLSDARPELLDLWVAAGGALDAEVVRIEAREQFLQGAVQPMVFGSAVTGTGAGHLLDLLRWLAPGNAAPVDCESSAEVFKVERGAHGARSVIARVWRGELEVRQTVAIIRPHADGEIEPQRITRLSIFRDGQEQQVGRATAGDIVRLGGLTETRIGDWIGTPIAGRVPDFEPPVFEYQVIPPTVDDRFALNQALAMLADEDPLISVRIDDVEHETFIHLYGEVQREVIESTLLDRFGLAVSFGDPAVLCVERLTGVGNAAEISGETNPPFYATVGFRIQPQQGPEPIWHYTPGKAKKNFFDAAEIGGRSALEQGLFGWPVVDLDVEVTELIYLVMSVPTDYRKLAALVMADAVRDAGTVVCEPVHRFAVRAPADASGGVIHLLTSNRGEIETTSTEAERAVIEGVIPAASIEAVARSLPGLTQGHGELESRFFDYAPVTGEPPRRRRTDLNPYNRIEYLSRLKGRF